MNIKMFSLALVAAATLCALAGGHVLVAQEASQPNTIITPGVSDVTIGTKTEPLRNDS